MEDFTPNPHVSLVITPELELALKIMSNDHERFELIEMLTKTIRGEFVDIEDMYELTAQAYAYFTGPDYYIKDLILPRLSDPRKTK